MNCKLSEKAKISLPNTALSTSQEWFNHNACRAISIAPQAYMFMTFNQLTLTCCGMNCGFCPWGMKAGGPGPIICTVMGPPGGEAYIGGLFGF